MVKKGKEKASAPPAPPASQAGSSKDGSKSKKGTSQAPAAPAAPILPPPKPTVKQIIGGTSWTGKLPVNLLSEHCQKQHWGKPEYNTIKTHEGFSVLISLSAVDPKTQELVKLDSFKLPPSHKHLVCRPTALEAKHAAATYALFRVCSMQNKHTIMPPDYKDLWKDFQAIKAEDVKDGKGWMYAPDPFKALQEREEAKVAAEKDKKRREQELARKKAEALPGLAGLALRSGAGGASGGLSSSMKGWVAAPKIEMGKRTRTQIEALIRKDAVWNRHGVQMPPPQASLIIKELSQLGFRHSHVQEATDICKDREETLEWLLIHVPEDDLPAWALPGTYSAGITVASTDLKRTAATERLAQSGYSLELCGRVLDENGGDEGKAAALLQRMLVASGSGIALSAAPVEAATSWESDQQWEEEVATLQSVFGDRLKQRGNEVIEIKISSVSDGRHRDIDTSVQIRKAPNYPAELILNMISNLPSYIKLSVIKKTLCYVEGSLLDEPLKIYFVVDWIENNINDIVDSPGRLLDVSAVASAASEAPDKASTKKSRARFSKASKPIQWIPDAKSKEEWRKRQESPALKEMIRKRQKLPAWNVQERIVNTVDSNQVTIISGETGSGKSTQSMQFILDELYSRGLGHCANMIVTQPRRISALGLADRVADERCTRVGQEVGYAIRGENRRSDQTRITFVTTGVLLRRLQTSGGRIEDVIGSLADVSHVVIDEVHERSLDTDFLLTIIRNVMEIRKDILKLVLMSATLDANSFREYFESAGLTVGLVEIEGRTFPVEELYVDDIIRLTGFTLGSEKSYEDSMAKTIQQLGFRINYSLLSETVRALDAELSDSNKSGGILIFLPGVAEINQTCNALRSTTSLHVLPLHASLETKEQKRVFQTSPLGKRKVVVATNVAETSITIDDIVVVIDSGKVKETSFDPQNNMRKLEENWASRAACKQRRGRAGRVQAGKCYKLYTRNLEQQMAERPEPEIRRVPLEQLCLSVRAMGTRDVAHFLSQSPTPPESTAVDGAMKMLRKIGALDGDELTALGQQLAMIPADLRCGKLMVYGSIFGCLDDCVTIAAILSNKSPFISPQDKREEAKEARLRFSEGDGDLLTDLTGFQQWHEMMQDRVPQRQVRGFCEDNFLSYNTLSDIAATRTQYYAALAEIGIVEPRVAVADTYSREHASTSLLRALTASAFTPQIARIQFPDKKFASSMSGAVELDPEARLIKYFTQENGRVFVHPSSTIFDSQGFSGNAAFMSYFTMISTSKIFIRDLTRKLKALYCCQSSCWLTKSLHSV
jgi:ATP-dependent RNA helicase DHX57